MRKVIDLRRPLGSVPIEDIELDVKSRDDIPAILIGLQAIYRNEATREELFRLPASAFFPTGGGTPAARGWSSGRSLSWGC